MKTLNIATISLALLGVAACGGTGWQPQSPQSDATALEASPDTLRTVARFEEKSPILARFFQDAYGVAVFTSVGKGAITIGGAYGEGEVFEKKTLVGKTSLTQLSIGFAVGGQAYSEVIFFEDEAALRDFKSGNFELGAQASAVAVTAGVSADASYRDGVAIFTMTKGGLMYEAAVAGQKFSYRPL